MFREFTDNTTFSQEELMKMVDETIPLEKNYYFNADWREPLKTKFDTYNFWKYLGKAERISNIILKHCSNIERKYGLSDEDEMHEENKTKKYLIMCRRTNFEYHRIMRLIRIVKSRPEYDMIDKYYKEK